MLSKKDIEELATGAVRRYFNTCELISPQIQENDKSPDWDGFLNIYKHKKDIRANYVGSLRIQIKGKQVNDFEEKESFPVETVFLKNSRSEGFVFFVVEVKEDGASRIFYKMMAPIEIRSELSVLKEGQKTKTYSFDYLDDNKSIVSIQLAGFMEDCIKQKSFANKNELKIEDIQNAQEYQWGFSLQGKKENFAKDIFEGFKSFIYVKTKEGAEIPLGNGRMTIYFPEIRSSKEETVKISDVVVSESYNHSISKQFTTYEIPGILSLKINNDPLIKENNVNIDIIAKTTEQYIIAYTTYLQILKEKHIKFGEHSFDLKSSVDAPILSHIENKLEDFKKHAQVMEFLNVITPIDYNEFDEDDNISIKNLYSTLIEHQSISLNNPNGVFRLDIANICLLLSSHCDDNGKYYIDDFFESSNIKVTSGNGELPFQVPPFSWLEQKGYVMFDNIPYEKIINSYEKYTSIDKRVLLQANLDLLEMIKASDELLMKSLNSKREHVLNVSLSFSQWLMGVNEDSTLVNIHHINELQIKKRMRPLTDEEKSSLLRLTQSDDLMIKAAAYILLDNKDIAEYIVTQMEDEDRNVFTTFPIYNLSKIKLPYNN